MWGEFRFIIVCVSTLGEIKNGVWGNSFPQNDIIIFLGVQRTPNILIFWGERNLSPDPTHFISTCTAAPLHKCCGMLRVASNPSAAVLEDRV